MSEQGIIAADATAAPQPTRVCPKCATQSEIAGDYCPQCGARFSRRRRSRKARVALILVPVLLLLAGGGVAAAMIVHHNQQVAAQHRAVLRAAALRHQQQLALQQAARHVAQQAQQAQQQLANAERASMVSSLQASVKKTAQSDVNSGVLNGPILQVQCQPATTTDATAAIATYTCIAANSVSGGELNGYRFTATINTGTGSYTWHLGS